MITTIKVRKSTKKKLDLCKRNNETYDLVIQRFLEKEKAVDLRKRLIEGYTSMSEEEFEEFKEWDQLE